jgi:RimJ/RimL family protein N-acetyltransferase
VPPSAWPLYDLRVTTPRVTLRVPTEAELLRLAGRAAGKVLPAAQAGFMTAWTQLPSPEFERSFMQFHWRLRADWSPASWALALGVYPDGEDEPAGSIDASASEFAATRAASMGWWLLPDWRGRGIGKEALAALLHLLFDGLGAIEARAHVHPDNAASRAIAEGNGFRADGRERILGGDGQALDAIRVRLTRADWTRRDDIGLTGLDPELFGL